jgi:hypothetical protein
MPLPNRKRRSNGSIDLRMEPVPYPADSNVRDFTDPIYTFSNVFYFIDESMAVPGGMCPGMSTGVVMRMSVKTRDEIEKSFFADIFVGLFGTALLFMGMRIRMLFGHTDTLTSASIPNYGNKTEL